MVYEPKQQDLDLWEAWIDLEVPGSHGFGTLFVIGEIQVAPDQKIPQLRKADSGFGGTNILNLELVQCVLNNNGRVREIRYSEELRSPVEYDYIIVSNRGSVLARIEEIELIK